MRDRGERGVAVVILRSGCELAEDVVCVVCVMGCDAVISFRVVPGCRERE